MAIIVIYKSKAYIQIILKNVNYLKPKPIVRKATPKYGNEQLTNESATRNKAGRNTPIKLNNLREFFLLIIFF